jgi:hypothetical protein
MLEQQQEDSGSAASLMICIGIFTGSMWIAITSLNLGNTTPWRWVP